MGWVPRLHKALAEDSFELFVQTIIDLQTPGMAASHFEILIRLNEGGEIIPPSAFLPAAERYNFSSQIDRWVITNTLTLLNTHADKLGPDDIFNINCNKNLRNIFLIILTRKEIPGII